MRKLPALLLLLPLPFASGCRLIQSCGSSHDSTDSPGDTQDIDSGGWATEGDDYTGSFGVDMVAFLGPDTFTMGSDLAGEDSNEGPQHSVTLTHAFWLGRTEVTQYQYRTAMGVNPSYYADCDDCPVDQVTWFKAAYFANVMSRLGGFPTCYEDVDGDGRYALQDPDPYACAGYRLSTEAEWEYAAGGREAYTYSGSDDPDDVAWTTQNSDGAVHKVCTLAPNALGFCDLSGNVWELVGDGYGSYEGDETDPHGPDGSEYRVNRGGSWHDEPGAARVTNRSRNDPTFTASNLGFRLARSVP